MLCDYGCGKEALFVMTTGKNCCSSRYNSCPAVRSKISKSISKAHKEGKIPTDFGGKEKRGWAKGKIFAEFGSPGRGQPKAFKALLINERGHQCESCLLTEWKQLPITLELEHVDGDRNNNSRDNLKLLCPNCHSQTDTWKRGTSPGWRKKKYSDDVIINTIKTSATLNEVLRKLDLRYGSASTIVDVMIKYKVNFGNMS